MSARFLEISVSSTDLLGSLNFYRDLGFRELSASDAWAHGYAVVSDGHITVGLHDHDMPRPAVTLVLPELLQAALSLGDSPRLESMNIEQDSFNSVSLVDHDDHGLMLVEARTFSPDSEATPQSLLGELLEYTLPVRNAVGSAQFWAPWTRRSLGLSESPRMHMRLALDSLPLGLSEQASGRRPLLCYRVDDLATLGVTLDRMGMPLRVCGVGIDGCQGMLESPEGLQFAIFADDFLASA